MVRAYFPQGGNRNLDSNSNYAPQSYLGGGGGVSTFADVTYVSGGQRGSTAYRFGGQQGKVDYEVVI